jgi:flavin reductase (DIM6/NTAB) family NADH-FMN oxidoreductase RutF
VFGEPYEKDGVPVIPVARVQGGGGGGQGDAPEGGGSGGGFGLSARPAGVFTVKAGTVRWEPALDINRIIIGGQIVAAVGIPSRNPKNRSTSSAPAACRWISSANWSLVQRSRRFAVNILSSAHVDIADTFAGRRGLAGHDRYIDPRWQLGPGRVPRLRDALAVIECELEEAIQRYTHAILIGRVVDVVSDNSRSPLVYWQGGYSHICY